MIRYVLFIKYQSFKAIKMSTVIKSLFIPLVDISHNAEYIMDALYCNNIAVVSSVTIKRVSKKSRVFNRAYIDIAEWMPSEAAYNFIQRLKDPSKEARFVHGDDDWWHFEINKKSSSVVQSKKPKHFTTINHLLDKNDFTGLDWLLCGDIDKENEWKTIEKDLSEMLAYQNLEYELCL